jgi:MYXO-CTERM domain-containing protein
MKTLGIDSIQLSGVTQATANDVPEEPASLAMFAAGLGLLGLRRRRR